jgi:predicted DNA-binding protein with PD1-like motif
MWNYEVRHTFLKRLPHDADLLTAIREAFEERGIRMGFFQVIGAVKQARIAFYDQKDRAYRGLNIDSHGLTPGSSAASHPGTRGAFARVRNLLFSSHGEREGEAHTALPGEGATRAPLIEEAGEILSCTGNVSELEGELLVHAHIVLGLADGTTRGGHLVQGTRIFAGELFGMALEGEQLRRAYDEVTGLKLWPLTPGTP